MSTTRSGKTTLAKQLASLFGVPHVELDVINWQPNWTELNVHDRPEFRRRVEAAVLASDGWAVDGNYSVVRDLVWPRSTVLVWLDYPLWLTMWRLLWRTLRRVRTQEVLWAGNQGRFRNQFLSRDSLFIWAFKSYWRRHRSYPLILAKPEHTHLRLFRHRSPQETERWLRLVASGEGPLDAVRPEHVKGP